MRILVLLVILSFFTGTFTAFSQGVLEKRTVVETRGKQIEVDPLGNCYVIKENEIEKYTAEGELEYTYSNFLTGEITSVDASDPFKILVFYKDFGQINILDNTLSETGDPVLLQLYNLELASLVCRSYNSGVWVYDPQNFELVRFNDQMQITDRTGNINQVLGVPIDPEHLVEEDNMVYLSDPSEGIFSFDRYGTYFRTYPFQEIKTFQVAGSRIIFLAGNEIHYYDTRKMTQTTLKLPVAAALDAKISYDIQPEQLFVLDKTQLYIFVKN